MKKVVLVTGVSSELGREMAELLSRSDYHVFGASRNAALIRPIAGVRMLELDMSDQLSISRCVQEALGCLGCIDVMVITPDAHTTKKAARKRDVSNDLHTALQSSDVHRLIVEALPSMRRNESGLIIAVGHVQSGKRQRPRQRASALIRVLDLSRNSYQRYRRDFTRPAYLISVEPQAQSNDVEADYAHLRQTDEFFDLITEANGQHLNFETSRDARLAARHLKGILEIPTVFSRMLKVAAARLKGMQLLVSTDWQTSRV